MRGKLNTKISKFHNQHRHYYSNFVSCWNNIALTFLLVQGNNLCNKRDINTENLLTIESELKM